VITPLIGRPRIGAERQVTHRTVSRQGLWDFLSNGGTISATASRDQGNTEDPLLLRPGLLMGKITSGGKWAPSILGLTNGAYASGTSLTLSVAAATELNRRVGASGTFKLTGPPAASGTVRTVTVTYSAVNTSTGVVTITAIPVAAVWTLVHTAGTDGGFYMLKVTTPDGVSATTTALAWNADTATVDAAMELLPNVGVAGVAAVFAVDTLTLTFAAALGDVEVEVVNDTTSDGGVFEGGWVVTHTTTGVAGAFVTASAVQPTDGSETIRSLIPDGYGISLGPDGAYDVEWPNLPIAGVIDFAQTLPLVADASLKTWVKQQLSTLVGGKFTFSDGY
jgi:hypothetical protein